MEDFLEFAAAVFECDPSELSGDTAYGAFDKWDSLTMLRLIMEVEEQYNVVIPIENTGKIRTLSDIYTEYIENK